jgi:hypothetical protein
MLYINTLTHCVSKQCRLDHLFFFLLLVGQVRMELDRLPIVYISQKCISPLLFCLIDQLDHSICGVSKTLVSQLCHTSINTHNVCQNNAGYIFSFVPVCCFSGGECHNYVILPHTHCVCHNKAGQIML